MYQISVVHLPGSRRTMIEDEHEVLRLRQWLPAGPTATGGHRERDLVQFTAKHGGVRTVPVADLVDVK